MSLDERLETHSAMAERVLDRLKRRRVDLNLAPAAVQSRPVPAVRSKSTSRTAPGRPPAPDTGRDARLPPLNALQTNKRHAYGPGYDPALESIRQDLARDYIDRGSRPQNAIGLAAIEERFEEHPRCVQLRQAGQPLRIFCMSSLRYEHVLVRADAPDCAS